MAGAIGTHGTDETPTINKRDGRDEVKHGAVPNGLTALTVAKVKLWARSGDKSFLPMDQDVVFGVAHIPHIGEEFPNRFGKDVLRLRGVGSGTGTVSEGFRSEVHAEALLADDGVPCDGDIEVQAFVPGFGGKQGEKVSPQASDGDGLTDGDIAGGTSGGDNLSLLYCLHHL